MRLNRDFSDLLSDFRNAEVRFLVVGAYAMVLHGRPRTTGDLDLWVDPAPSNAARVFEALGHFGAPLAGFTPRDFQEPGVVFQIGVAPNRIDVLTSLTGLKFQNAWSHRRRKRYGDIPISVLSEADLIRNKRMLGRPRDLADVEEMKKVSRRVKHGSSRR